jgi:hypothetical protein
MWQPGNLINSRDEKMPVASAGWATTGMAEHTPRRVDLAGGAMSSRPSKGLNMAQESIRNERLETGIRCASVRTKNQP